MSQTAARPAAPQCLTLLLLLLRRELGELGGFEKNHLLLHPGSHPRQKSSKVPPFKQQNPILIGGISEKQEGEWRAGADSPGPDPGPRAPPRAHPADHTTQSQHRPTVQRLATSETQERPLGKICCHVSSSPLGSAHPVLLLSRAGHNDCSQQRQGHQARALCSFQPAGLAL